MPKLYDKLHRLIGEMADIKSKAEAISINLSLNFQQLTSQTQNQVFIAQHRHKIAQLWGYAYENPTSKAMELVSNFVAQVKLGKQDNLNKAVERVRLPSIQSATCQILPSVLDAATPIMSDIMDEIREHIEPLKHFYYACFLNSIDQVKDCELSDKERQKAKKLSIDLFGQNYSFIESGGIELRRKQQELVKSIFKAHLPKFVAKLRQAAGSNIEKCYDFGVQSQEVATFFYSTLAPILLLDLIFSAAEQALYQYSDSKLLLTIFDREHSLDGLTIEDSHKERLLHPNLRARKQIGFENMKKNLSIGNISEINL